jgi:hypothetical protein
VLAIALIVGRAVRSSALRWPRWPGAATAYVIAIRVVVWLAGRMGVPLPPDLDPVLVVLLLGVTTDYTVFFLDGMRAQSRAACRGSARPGWPPAEFAPIILAAGIIVAARGRLPHGGRGTTECSTRCIRPRSPCASTTAPDARWRRSTDPWGCRTPLTGAHLRRPPLSAARSRAWLRRAPARREQEEGRVEGSAGAVPHGPPGAAVNLPRRRAARLAAARARWRC